MSGSFKRALGIWLQAASGVTVRADNPESELAHPAYPMGSLIELATETAPASCGIRDHVSRDEETNYVETSGRLFVSTEDYRFQVRAADETGKPGRHVIDDALNATEEAVMALRAQRTPKILTDTATTPSVSYQVEHISIGNRRAQEADAKALPVIYSGTATVRVIRFRQVDRTVDGVMEHIDVHEQEA